MKRNPLLEERPGHEHYAVCAGRKAEIEKLCTRTVVYTAAVCIIMFIFTLFTVSFPIISFIPDIFGEPWDLAHIFVQTVELIGITAAAAFCTTRSRKYLLIVMMIFYAVLAVGSIFTGTLPGDFIAFAAGVAGVVITCKAPWAYRDYKQLMETEGWPHFSTWYTESMEKPRYSYDRYRRPAEDDAEKLRRELEKRAEEVMSTASESARVRLAGMLDSMPSIGAAAPPAEPEATEMTEDNDTFDPM